LESFRPENLLQLEGADARLAELTRPRRLDYDGAIACVCMARGRKCSYPLSLKESVHCHGGHLTVKSARRLSCIHVVQTLSAGRVSSVVLPQFGPVLVKPVTKPQNKPMKLNPWFVVPHGLVLIGNRFQAVRTGHVNRCLPYQETNASTLSQPQQTISVALYHQVLCPS